MNKQQRYYARKHGKDIPLMKPGKKPMDNLQRFELHFVKTIGCWLWIGCRHKFGYGKFKIWPERADKDAHRASYQLYVGEIPDGLYVLHRCHVPACVNPDHLYLGTQKRNVKDMWEAGRARMPAPMPGEKNPSAKLNTGQVSRMRQLRKDGIKINDIASIFNISFSHTKRILKGTNWRRI